MEDMKEPFDQMKLTISCDPTRQNKRIMRIIKRFAVDELNRGGLGSAYIKCESLTVEELYTTER